MANHPRDYPQPNGPDGRTMKRAVTILAIAAGLSALTIPAEAAGPDVSISDAWMRVIVPSRPAAGYFKLENMSDEAVDLTAASSPGCGMLMLHQSVHENGMDKMMMVKSIAVPAHSKVEFAPGGYHLMCMSPSADLKPGASVPVTLKFASGDITVDFAVKDATGK